MIGAVIRRSVMATVVATVALVVLAACSPDTSTGTDPDSAPPPVSPTPGEASTPVRPPLLPEGVDVVAIPVERYTAMWEVPGVGGIDFYLDTRNPHGVLAPMLVADARRANGNAWYEVYLPLRPNGTTAWVRERDVLVRERTERIEVDLSDRILRRVVDGEVVSRLHVGVGTPQTPTGVGTFYVWVKVRYANPSQAYGIMALGLSGFSPVLSDWPGEGRMAVHGTPDPSDRGRAVSHGCVRVCNGDMLELTDVPLGTPVVISE
jgi:lipoprotein-anchoring transpeptidase ErfK/SrfK